jgi:Ca2+-binding EF-hand superfamily protein
MEATGEVAMNVKVPGVWATLLTSMFWTAAPAQPVVAAAATEFKAMDANRDGKVTREEHAAAARGMFDKMDANHDGKVTAAEMDAAHNAIAGGDAGKNELSASDKIKAVDQDRDGTLTAAEHAYGSRSMFDKMDVNHDGVLTPDEMAAGHAAMLKK